MLNHRKLIFLGAGLLFSVSVLASSGKDVYDKTCMMCHGSGLAGAPKIGDKAAWKDRIATGMDNLVKSAINGKQGYTGMMPPRGGNPNLSDKEIHAAVKYMVGQSK